MAHTLTVLTSEYPPYVQSANSELTGYSIDVFNEVQRRLGWSYDVELQPWARVYNQVISKPNVLIMFLSRTSYREDLVQWSLPYSQDTMHLYALASRTDVSVTRPEDLTNHSVVAYRNGATDKFLDDMGFKPSRLVKVNTPEQLVELLHRGRVDLAADFDKGFVYNSLHFNSEKVVSQPLTQLIDRHISVSFALSLQSNPDIIRQINEALTAMEKDDELARLQRKWFSYMEQASE